MKYKPLHSNFDEMQNEIAERLLAVHSSIEDIKDAVAREIDDYVAAILKEHVEEVKVHTWSGDNDCPVHVMFMAGEKQTPTCIDLFARRIPLTEVLDAFNDWDDLGSATETEPESIKKLADHIQAFADRLRKRADEIEKENAEWDRQWAMKNSENDSAVES